MSALLISEAPFATLVRRRAFTLFVKDGPRGSGDARGGQRGAFAPPFFASAPPKICQPWVKVPVWRSQSVKNVTTALFVAQSSPKAQYFKH